MEKCTNAISELFEEASHFPGRKMTFESCTYLQMIDIPVVKTCDFPASLVRLVYRRVVSTCITTGHVLQAESSIKFGTHITMQSRSHVEKMCAET